MSRASPKTSEELLAQLLTEPEYLAVLQYSKARALETDDAVFFLVAMLKTFAFVFDRILEASARSGHMVDDVALRGDGLVRRFDQIVGDRVETLKTVLREANDRMAFHVGELRASTAEIRLLLSEVEKVSTEARGVYRAFERLADDGSGAKLSEAFQKAAIAALDRRVPFFDDTIRSYILDTVRGAMRKVLVLMGAQFVMLALLLFMRG